MKWRTSLCSNAGNVFLDSLGPGGPHKQAVDRHFCPGTELRQTAREADLSRLGSAVVQHAGDCAHSRLAGNQDDPALQAGESDID